MISLPLRRATQALMVTAALLVTTATAPAAHADDRPYLRDTDLCGPDEEVFSLEEDLGHVVSSTPEAAAGVTAIRNRLVAIEDVLEQGLDSDDEGVPWFAFLAASMVAPTNAFVASQRAVPATLTNQVIRRLEDIGWELTSLVQGISETDLGWAVQTGSDAVARVIVTNEWSVAKQVRVSAVVGPGGNTLGQGSFTVDVPPHAQRLAVVPVRLLPNRPAGLVPLYVTAVGPDGTPAARVHSMVSTAF